jgi:hypothetical protein
LTGPLFGSDTRRSARSVAPNYADDHFRCIFLIAASSSGSPH